MSAAARVVILCRKSQWGLAKDAAWVEQVLREAHATRTLSIVSIDHIDPIECINPRPVDIQIHLEVPCRLAWPWAKYNIVVVNPEWWPATAWNWALTAADRVVFKGPHAAALFPEVDPKKVTVIPWRIPAAYQGSQHTPQKEKERKFLAVVGASANKTAAMRTVVSTWSQHATWPLLEVWGTPQVVEELRGCLPTDCSAPANVTWVSEYRSEDDLRAAQRASAFHCCASVAEGWGHTMGECAAAESLPLWCDLPVQSHAWRILGDVGRINTDTSIGASASTGADASAATKNWNHCEEGSKGNAPQMATPFGSIDPPLSYAGGGNVSSPLKYREPPRLLDVKNVERAVESLLALDTAAYTQAATSFRRAGVQYSVSWRESWKGMLKPLFREMRRKEQPLVLRRLKAEELPTVGIVTLTRNRPKWWTNMAQNILKTDYPTEKLVWVIVDDGDTELKNSVNQGSKPFSEGSGRVDEQVLKFQQSAPSIRVEYLSLPKPLSIGAKRNRGCAAAVAAGAEILMMMDDDDHYPKSSVEARATYMQLLKVPCVYCSRLPMYDCKRYISAMNVPPLDLAPAERVSEATLAFTKAFWEERGFPEEVAVAEAEDFIAGREAATAEIVPEGVIVSFLHGKNYTARNVPAAQDANGCHYGFSDEFFMYLCERGENKD